MCRNDQIFCLIKFCIFSFEAHHLMLILSQLTVQKSARDLLNFFLKFVKL